MDEKINSSSINLVLYSNNEPFDTSKRLTIETIHNFTKKNIIIHDYNLDRIKKLEWFKKIKYLPNIYKDGRRDGYYNSWKAYIVKDVYDNMADGDILYYVDCSQYFITGFTENIDKLCDIVNEKKCIAGSVGYDTKNNSVKCCDNISVWNKIVQNRDNTQFLDKMHVLNSWFLFMKCDSNTAFINDWAYFTGFTDNDFKVPLVTYHHTGDQSIFNILVIKYNLPVFYAQDIDHLSNKDKNLVIKIINNTKNYNKYFIHLCT